MLETAGEEIDSHYEGERKGRNNLSVEEIFDEENDKDDSADKLKKVWNGITSSTTEDEVTKDGMVPYIKGKKVLFVHCEN